MKTKLLAVTVAVIAVVSAALCGCGAESVVKKVDHIAIQCSDAQGLFDFFTKTLGLPAAWPFESYPQFETGGVQAGNVNIETLHYGPEGDTGTLFYGIVMDPYPLSEITDELKARGAKPSKPEVQKREVDGKEIPIWTNVYLEALCYRDYVVYLCEYEDAVKSSLDKREVEGPLGEIGLESVREVVIESKDSESLKQEWAEVFAPCSFSSEGKMVIGTGPAVRITDGKEDSITEIVLEVTSIEKAKEFLEKNRLLGRSSSDELRIDPDKVQGLGIRIVEK